MKCCYDFYILVPLKILDDKQGLKRKFFKIFCNYRKSGSNLRLLRIVKTTTVGILLSIVVLIISYQNIHAFGGTIRFEKGIDGLPTQMEGNIVRDDDGFLWFCFYGGIARYDGKEVKYYEPGPNSLSGSATLSIVLDKSGALWILTKDNGLNKYDKATDTFTQYKHNPDNSNSISSDFSDSFCPQRLFVDRSGRVLIGTLGGFDIYDPRTDTFTHHRNIPGNPNSLSKNNVTAILQDRDGLIWIGTSGGGLNKFNPDTDTWTRYQNDPDDVHSLASDTIWSLAEDNDGLLWVGTWDKGLDLFDKKTNIFTHFQYDPENPDGIAANNIYNLKKDQSGNIWLTHKASKGVGLEMYDKKTGKFNHYANDPKNEFSISSNRISSVYEDPVTGIFWVVNTNKGIIDKYDPNSRKFELYRHDPDNPDSLYSDAVIVMLEDKQGNFWISAMGGIDQLDRDTGKFIHHPYKEIDPAMGPYALAMLEDSDGDFWILNDGGTLTKFDIEKMKPIKHYVHNPDDPNSLMVNTSYGDTILEDKENPGVLWIVLSSGLEKFNKNTEKFTHYIHNPNDPNSITPGTVWSVWDDSRGNLWISTFGGLNKFNKKTELFTRYVHDPKNPDSIGFNKNSCVFEDSFGNFWVAGFTNGMDKFDRKTGKFKHFNKDSGFPAVGINHTIQEDRHGNLWIGSTESGLIKFNIKTQSVINVYTKNDGLQDNAFWRSYKTRDGKMWFGGGGGLSSFYPDRVINNSYIPPVVLTSFKQGGQNLDLGMAPEKLKQITLDWKTNFFEFQFAALNYTKPEKNQYAFMLEGRDKNWYYSGNNCSGRYTGLSGGKYLLKLKGSNNDGIWNETGAFLKITIIQPFWKTIWFYSLIFCGVLFLIAGTIIYLNKLKFEIKERNLAQASLGREKEFTETVINSQQDTFFLFEPDTGKAVQWNKAFNQNSGYSDEEILKMKAPDSYYDSNSLNRAKPFIEKIIKTGVGTIELDLICKDGSKVPTEYSTSVINDDNGTPKYLISIGRDLTERKQLELQFSQLAENSTDWIWEFDENNIFTYSSKGVTNMLGYTPEEIIGKSAFDLIPSPEKEKVAKEFAKSKEIHASFTNLLNINQHKDGHRVTIESSGSPIFNSKGEFKGYRGIDRDVSYRKKMEEELRQAHKMESIGTLAGGIAHDFNNILGIIIGNAELAVNDLPEWSPAFSNIKEIKTASLRAKDVVRQLLSFSRKTDQEQKPIDIIKIVKESIKLIRASIPSSIKIHKEIPEKIDPILADATQIHQVLLNLCTNASHAMIANDGLMEIILRPRTLKQKTSGILIDLPPGSYVELIVKDSGAGIDPEIRHKIFDPYFTTKDVGKGTGMGLAVVHGIVKNHNGAIFIDSEPGEGTSFTILFPAIAEEPQQHIKVTVAEFDPPGKETILFVDDEEALADMSKIILEKLGYTVHTSTNPEQALSLFKADPNYFDLVISDMTMPHMSGVKLSEELKKVQKDVSIIICTGHTSLIDEEEAKNIGISALAMKPIMMSEIAKLIRSVLDT